MTNRNIKGRIHGTTSSLYQAAQKALWWDFPKGGRIFQPELKNEPAPFPGADQGDTL